MVFVKSKSDISSQHEAGCFICSLQCTFICSIRQTCKVAWRCWEGASKLIPLNLHSKSLNIFHYRIAICHLSLPAEPETHAWFSRRNWSNMELEKLPVSREQAAGEKFADPIGKSRQCENNLSSLQAGISLFLLGSKDLLCIAWVSPPVKLRLCQGWMLC